MCLQEGAKELFQRESHGAALAVMGVVLSAKGDVNVVQCEESMIGDRHAMGVAGQILKHVLRPAKRRLRVDVPFLPKEIAQQRLDELGQGIGGHFLHHPPAVCLGGQFAGAELGGDLFVEHAGDYQVQHFFPRGP
jgi:hypothetical protein